ncbi:hypothetical protein MANES_06G011400v8 [Manihot esculenta]|uniref:Uncharacterized protein n=2 Tax=Manihot esculenta TaxID=3983 RepID=A0A2C9VLR8_MANES|nr:hypothetical protein MANES_06G011400v8 [Manihot esculenta]
MAASLLSSPSLCNHRINQAFVHLHSSHQTGMKCNFKLYMVPAQAISRYCTLRTFTSVASLNVEVACEGNSSAASSPSDLLRSKTLLQSPSNASDGMNDLERQLQELYDEVKAMTLMGNKDDAVDLLQANYGVVKEQINAGSRGIEEAATLEQFLSAFMNKVVESLKDDEPLLDSVLIHMGSMYSALGKFQSSMVVYKRAIGVLESKHGKSSIFLISPLLGMAKILGSIGRVKKAMEVYHRSIAILESSKGVESEDLVVPLFGLGNLMMKEGRTTDSEIHFNRILSIYRKLYGENDGRVGMALCSLAHAKCSTGNVEEAIDLYKKDLQLIKDTNYIALDDSIMEKMRIDLAELLHVVGRGKEGRELLEECLLISERSKGKDHPSSVSHLINLATSYSQSKNFVEAERLLRISLELMAKTVSPEDQSITFPMLHLAVTLYHLNRDEEAEQLALKVLRIREKAFEKDSSSWGGSRLFDIDSDQIKEGRC